MHGAILGAGTIFWDIRLCLRPRPQFVYHGVTLAGQS